MAGTKRKDFGEKIGGARKDMWSGRGLAINDLKSMNEAERAKFVKKDQIWPKPDYAKLYEDGKDRQVVYFIKCLRNAIPTGPLSVYGLSVEEAQEAYIDIVSKIRDAAMRCESIKDVCDMRHLILGYVVDNETIKCSKLYRVAPYSDHDYECGRLSEGVRKDKFLYSREETILADYKFVTYNEPNAYVHRKSDGTSEFVLRGRYSTGSWQIRSENEEMKDPDAYETGKIVALKGWDIVGKNFNDVEEAKKYVLSVDTREDTKEAETKRKTNLPIEPLKHIRATGFDYLHGRHAVESDYLEGCGFRGVEFGNWVSDKERIQHMDMAYSSIRNLSVATGIEVKSLLFGRLAVAFGARGVGKAMAHYEPLREVINLTRMKGAGSLAHEMGHFLDDEIGREYDLGGYATEHSQSSHAPEAMRKLMSAMKNRQLTHAEAKIYLADKVDKVVEKTRKEILSMVSKGGLSEEERDELEDLVDQFIEEAKADDTYHNITFVSGSMRVKRDNAPSAAYKALMQFAMDHGTRSMLKVNIAYANQCRSQIADAIRVYKKALKVDPEIIVNSHYYDAAIALDGGYAHGGHGYYKSDVELFARAYAAYVKDKLAEKGIVDDYLCGHADACGMTNLGITYVSPRGEERARINKAFDELFDELVSDGTLERFVEKPSIIVHEVYEEPLLHDDGMQLAFVF